MKTRPSIAHYDLFADEYDHLSKKYAWHSPDILFGLAFEYIKSGQKLLDIGIGTGKSSALFKRIGLEIFGIDGSKEMLKRCKEKGIAIDLKQFDLNTTPFPYADHSFDHIISNGVLYFFDNLEPFFIEARRLLKGSEGIFGFTIENFEGDLKEGYVNKGNDYVSKRMDEKKGVKLFRHSDEYIKLLIKKHQFELLKELKYFAYTSLDDKRDIYFKVYIIRR